jgi:hypothetical protein
MRHPDTVDDHSRPLRQQKPFETRKVRCIKTLDHLSVLEITEFPFRFINPGAVDCAVSSRESLPQALKHFMAQPCSCPHHTRVKLKSILQDRLETVGGSWHSATVMATIACGAIHEKTIQVPRRDSLVG